MSQSWEMYHTGVTINSVFVMGKFHRTFFQFTVCFILKKKRDYQNHSGFLVVQLFFFYAAVFSPDFVHCIWLNYRNCSSISGQKVAKFYTITAYFQFSISEPLEMQKKL